MTKSLHRRIFNRVFHLLARLSPGSTSFRPMLHRWRGVKIGKEVFLGDDVFIDNEYPECVEIQDRVQISIRVVIVAHTRGSGRVIIERDTFVGPHCVIACSAGRTLTIGAGAVIGPGCVITRNVAPRTYLTLPAPRPIGIATVPLSTANTMEEFLGGLKPWAAPKGNPEPEAGQ
ncbi:MAG: acyltransferase [Verrucomicrobia bacterium]|nr:acyltransferase [Verrucomicrobiota bacterium]